MKKPGLSLLAKIIIGLIAVLGLTLIFKTQEISISQITPLKISEYLRGFGPIAIIVYLGLYCLNVVTVLPPIGIITMAAGMVFGFWSGALILLVGTMIGTSLTFFISRVIGRNQVENLLKGKAKQFDQKLEHNGFLTVLFFRVVPSLPFELTNYLCGLTKIRFKDYFFATFIGGIVWSLISAYFGAAVGRLDSVKDLFSKQFIIAGIVFVGLMVFSTWYGLRSKNK